MKGKREVRNDVPSGHLALLGAIFAQAWKDSRSRSPDGRARRARAFLTDPRTIRNLVDMGVDPDFYRQMIDAGDERAERELRRQIVRMYDGGWEVNDIVYAIWGYMCSTHWTTVRVALREARGEGD